MVGGVKESRHASRFPRCHPHVARSAYPESPLLIRRNTSFRHSICGEPGLNESLLRWATRTAGQNQHYPTFALLATLFADRGAGTPGPALFFPAWPPTRPNSLACSATCRDRDPASGARSARGLCAPPPHRAPPRPARSRGRGRARPRSAGRLTSRSRRPSRHRRTPSPPRFAPPARSPKWG